jgi:hypothetical protein
LTYEIPLTGTHDRELVHASEKMEFDQRPVWMPKHKYALAFADVNENLFDDHGVLRNQEELDLRWTLVNTFEALKKGIPLPYVGHLLRIWRSKFFFWVRRLLLAIGLWK